MARPALETAAAIVCAALAIGAVAYVAKQGSDTTRRRIDTASALTGGDPSRGAIYVKLVGCGACHEIAGVPGANGHVGPSPREFGARVYVAGVVPNTPANLIHWIRAPRELSPHTAMPTTGMMVPSTLAPALACRLLGRLRPGLFAGLAGLFIFAFAVLFVLALLLRCVDIGLALSNLGQSFVVLARSVAQLLQFFNCIIHVHLASKGQ